MITDKEKKDDVATAAIKSEKTFSKPTEPNRTFESGDQKKAKEEPLAVKTPEVSKNIPVEKKTEV